MKIELAISHFARFDVEVAVIWRPRPVICLREHNVVGRRACGNRLAASATNRFPLWGFSEDHTKPPRPFTVAIVGSYRLFRHRTTQICDCSLGPNWWFLRCQE